MEHTPTPWRVGDEDSFMDGYPHIEIEAGELGTLSYHQPVLVQGQWNGKSAPITDVSKANAARIVSCVNACEGIEDPSVVPELVEALERARVQFANYADIHACKGTLEGDQKAATNLAFANELHSILKRARGAS